MTIPNPTPFINSSAQLLVTEQVVVQPNDRFAIMPIFLYQRTKDGNPQHGWNQWVSFGARPEVFFTKHLSLAFEAGFDHTRADRGQYDGLAAQVYHRAANRSGKQILQPAGAARLLTYANWSDGFRGLVGGVPYQNQNERTDVWSTERNVVVRTLVHYESMEI